MTELGQHIGKNQITTKQNPFKSAIRNKEVKIPDYEQRIDAMFFEAFETNDELMLDWIKVKMELKRLRNAEEQYNDKNKYNEVINV